jgi:metallo-beta-lactamase class B
MDPRPTTHRKPGRRAVAAGAWLLLAAALLFGGYRAYLATLEPRWESARVPRLGRTARTLLPGIHLLGGLEPSAAYAVETAKGLVLIDAGLDAEARPLKAQLASLGLDWRRVCAVFLTHVHGDHSGGVEHLRRTAGARTYAGRGDVPVLRTGGPREAFFSTYHMPGQTLHATTTDVALDGGEVIDFGNLRIRALATPGHTPGSTCYVLERGRFRALFAGDVIMMLRGDELPRSKQRKPLGTYSAYLSPRYRGDARTYLASLRRLRALPVPDLVLPGHPASDPRPQGPCLSQARWEELLDGGIRDMETLLARYAQDGADFLDGRPRRLLPDLHYLGNYQGSAVYGFVARSRLFLIDAPGGPGLVEFVRQQLRVLGIGDPPVFAVLLTSCDPQARAGLSAWLSRDHVRVIVPRNGLDVLQRECPPGTELIAAEDLAAQGWFPVTTRPLRGRGRAPIAYSISWAGKTVLLSGRLPIVVNPETGGALFRDFLEGRGDASAYLEALGQLREEKADLWLPAVPVDEQNANLYDSEWDFLLEENALAIERNAHLLSTSGPLENGSQSSRAARDGDQ